jgi:16S rRNA pseudouridine516 synthase
MKPRIRLDRLLSNLGYGSRKDVTRFIKQGLFSLKNSVIMDPSLQIEIKDLLSGEALFDGSTLDPLPPLTLMIHKPRGYTCSHDEAGKLIGDLLPPRFMARDPVLSVAGRLDKDSTGLVLMTDDGDLMHKIISPKKQVYKFYDVTLLDPLQGHETDLFASGTFHLKNDPVVLKPAVWQPTSETTGIMRLQEGRYHQIRRMFGALGNKVTELHRTQIGGLELRGLAEGQYRILSSEDIQRIFEAS